MARGAAECNESAGGRGSRLPARHRHGQMAGMPRPIYRVLALATLAACSKSPAGPDASNPAHEPGSNPAAAPAELTIRAGKPVAGLPGEVHLKNVRQLTFDGENAEAYWSFDGTKLIFQRRNPPELPADQIFVLDLATGEQKLVSTGKGRCTCSYFLPGDRRIFYSSTHGASPEPPAAERFIEGHYVWPVFDTYDIYTANADGTGLVNITNSPGYDAEGTVDPKSGRIVFTSTRDGDIELYTMEPDGSDVRRLTNRPGYDGGAFYSHDGTKIVQRSGFLKNDEEKKTFYDLLAKGYVMPTTIEITVIDADGSHFRQVTDNGQANFAPYWLPDDHRIIFSSNVGSDPNDRHGGNFELYVIDEDGNNLEQITHNPSFDSFPMFSPDGRYLAFASNRYGSHEGNTNVFVAEWVENP